jgi:plasmid stabilization system protein ParE
MKMRILSVARREAEEATDHYENEREGLGSEFIDSLEEALKRVELFPSAWSKLDDNCRRCRLKRFPYGAVFRVHEDTIYVLAVMHLHRKPGYWRERLQELE